MKEAKEAAKLLKEAAKGEKEQEKEQAKEKKEMCKAEKLAEAARKKTEKDTMMRCHGRHVARSAMVEAQAGTARDGTAGRGAAAG